MDRLRCSVTETAAERLSRLIGLDIEYSKWKVLEYIGTTVTLQYRKALTLQALEQQIIKVP